VAGVEDVHCGLSTDRYALQKDFIRGRLRGGDLLIGDRKHLLHRLAPHFAGAASNDLKSSILILGKNIAIDQNDLIQSIVNFNVAPTNAAVKSRQTEPPKKLQRFDNDVQDQRKKRGP
jgi:hypothetical protein